MKLFEQELSALARMSKLEKMKMRKKITNVVYPTLTMNLRHSKVFMDIVEEKLHDVFDLFLDGWAFRKKLAKKMDEKLKKRT